MGKAGEKLVEANLRFLAIYKLFSLRVSRFGYEPDIP